MTGGPAADTRSALIVGGGLAGLCAAVRAAELGIPATLLEAGKAEDYACNSRMAMGFLNVAFYDIGAPPSVLREAITHMTSGKVDTDLADVLACEAAPALAWLRGLGVRTIVGNWRPGSAALLAPPAALQSGRSRRGRGPDRMLRLLAARLERSGGSILRGVRARRLLIENGRCVGIEAEVGGERQRFAADAVVIADGGFAGDPALIAKHIAATGTLLQRNAGTARGDGMHMAWAAGSKLTSLGGFYGHVHCTDALHDPRLWPYPTCDHLCGAGIAVDHRGRRFADEGRGGIYLANCIAGLGDPNGAVAVFDHRAWMTRGTAFPLPANPLLATGGATIHSAASLTRLAERAGLPPALAETVARYNHALAHGAEGGLVPARSARLFAPLPIVVPPFHAVPLVAGITYTTGGIAIDARCRVVHRSGGTIAGLYAAGSATGGHEDGGEGGYTGGLSKALVFGKRAGETIARDLAAGYGGARRAETSAGER